MHMHDFNNKKTACARRNFHNFKSCQSTICDYNRIVVKSQILNNPVSLLFCCSDWFCLFSFMHRFQSFIIACLDNCLSTTKMHLVSLCYKILAIRNGKTYNVWSGFGRSNATDCHAEKQHQKRFHDSKKCQKNVQDYSAS